LVPRPGTSPCRACAHCPRRATLRPVCAPPSSLLPDDTMPSTDRPPTLPARRPPVIVVGGGPAGLMAAEVLAEGGAQVYLYDAMPSVGRKFLLAGKGGLNLTHAEELSAFLDRYAERCAEIAPFIEASSNQHVRDWALRLGIECFVGSSDRVFPKDMNAAPLLRAWLQRLRAAGVRFHMRHRWQGWTADGHWRFTHPGGELLVRADAAVLALGGASWARLGSDGSWAPMLQARGTQVASLKASNCGFDVAPTGADREGWSEHLRSRFAGQPLKPVAIHFTDALGTKHHQQGEFVLTDTGVEGSLVYAFSARLRQAIETQGSATIDLDL